MPVIFPEDTFEQIRDKIVTDRSPVICDLRVLNSSEKRRLKFILETCLLNHNQGQYTEDIFFILIELAFNGFKANYIYSTALSIFRNKYEAEYKKFIDRPLNPNFQLPVRLTRLIHSRKVINKIREIFAVEGKLINLNENAALENRALTAWEKNQAVRMNQFLAANRDPELKITLKISQQDNFLIFHIINQAPITSRGLNRILTKRKIVRRYYDRDRIPDFYMEQLDNTESAGFGVAMIDIRLLRMELDPWFHFRINKLVNRTISELRIPSENSGS